MLYDWSKGTGNFMERYSKELEVDISCRFQVRNSRALDQRMELSGSLIERNIVILQNELDICIFNQWSLHCGGWKSSHPNKFCTEFNLGIIIKSTQGDRRQLVVGRGYISKLQRTHRGKKKESSGWVSFALVLWCSGGGWVSFAFVVSFMHRRDMVGTVVDALMRSVNGAMVWVLDRGVKDL
ncbi:unnamed protein product [Fraxinus pennsylvanica]|uniref:Uncharacterized protein n=1 Tax=Fraxinus pennsylvanica TaxID=56036 RepID=A0AAD2DVK9_9LAMI|nr:unnamed protein product [Fraxinus pennsylvanica]